MSVPENLPELGIQGYLAWKVFGPPAGAVGNQLERLVEFAGDNVRRVVGNSVEKLGERVEDEGSVSARSLLKTLEEATVADEQVIAEYLGGVLASARSENGRDDRSVSWSALIGRLSTDQLRLHFVLYSGLQLAARGRRVNLMQERERKELAAYLSFHELFPCAGWLDDGGHVAAFRRFTEAFDGLYREGLLEGKYSYGAPSAVRAQAPGISESGLAWNSSIAGIRLYLWGHGFGQEEPAVYLEERDFVVVEDGLTVPRQVKIIADLEAAIRKRQEDAGQTSGGGGEEEEF